MMTHGTIPESGSISIASTQSPASVRVARVVSVLAFALLTAVAAGIKYPIPGSPVPATLQTLVVLAGGLLLGPWLGGAGIALYLALGVVGLPVFAGGGAGVQTIVGATGGYLVAFLLVQPLLG